MVFMWLEGWKYLPVYNIYGEIKLTLILSDLSTFLGDSKEEIIEIKLQNSKFEMLTKFPFIGCINHLSISHRIRDMTRNTPAVLHAGVSTCGRNCIVPIVATQQQQCQPCPIWANVDWLSGNFSGPSFFFFGLQICNYFANLVSG